MHHVTDRNRAFVIGEAETPPDGMSERTAAQQADPGEAPDGAETGGAAIENQLAEDREQDLRRPAAGGPADVDQSESENERGGAHIPQALDVFVPWPHHLGFGERAARRAEAAARQKQPRNAQR